MLGLRFRFNDPLPQIKRKMKAEDNQKCFDLVVVGSSPLMILHAIRHAKRGIKVCIVDINDVPGGCWRHVYLEDQPIESACHLFEPFHRIYDVLEEVTGVEFLPMDPQPIRLYAGGILPRFSTRTFLVCRFLKAIATIVGNWVGPFLKLFGLCREEQLEALRWRAVDCRAEVLDFFRYHVPLFFRFNLTVKYPKIGYIGLVDTIWKMAAEVGVVQMVDEVTVVESKEGRWRLQLKSGSELISDEVALTSSTGMEAKRNGAYHISGMRSVSKEHILVGIPPDGLNVAQSYIHVGIRSNFVRFFRLYGVQIDSDILYLLEVKRGTNPHDEEVSEILEKSRIIRHGAEVKVLKRFSIDVNIVSRSVHPEGYVDDGLYILSSRANLASGILNWHRGTSRHSPGRSRYLN